MSTDSVITQASGISHSGSVKSDKVLELDEIITEVSRVCAGVYLLLFKVRVYSFFFAG